MSTRSRTISVALGLTLLTSLVGCRHSPYGGYGGYPGGGGYYGDPNLGQPYQAQPGTFVAPGATPGPALQVPPTGGAFIPNTPHATVIPGGDAPAFDPTTDAPAGDGNLVPDYNDPGSFTDPPAGDSFDSQPSFEDDAGFDDNPGGNGFSPDGFDDDAFKDAPFEDTSARPTYDDPRVELRGIEPLGSESLGGEPLEFEQPFPASTPSRLEETSVRTNRPSPYAYDRDSFAWLRGTIDYDEAAGTWAVIYAVRPEVGDEFGGSIELSGPPALFKSLETGDVVLVEGRVDPNDRDARGKARYRVDHCAELVPAG